MGTRSNIIAKHADGRWGRSQGMNPNGAIIYEGASALDGAPIVVIVTGLRIRSANEKTGDMLQTWILRSDVSPIEALRTGADASICGDCRHRPANDGTCYVNVGAGVNNVWEAYKAGRYARTPFQDIERLGVGRMVRLGSYGDPAAVPLPYWRRLTLKAAGWTGYTHQWAREGLDPAYKDFCMASVDSEAEAMTARKKRWRTFRVRSAAAPLMDRYEIACPASKEAGAKTDCAICKACMGQLAKARVNIAIVAHGSRARQSKEA